MNDANRDVGVVLAAAGAGVRFGGKKQLVRLAGRPLLFHSVEVFEEVEAVRELVVVVPPEEVVAIGDLLSARKAGGAPGRVVEGGGCRRDSVSNGLQALSPECRHVLVHDAARPLIRPDKVREAIDGMRAHGAVAVGFPSLDSVKVVEAEQAGRDAFVERNVPRDLVWLVQTPQGARVELLRAALDDGKRSGFKGTDEASFLERLDCRVYLVEGSRENIKITFPEDLELAEFLLRRRDATPEEDPAPKNPADG